MPKKEHHTCELCEWKNILRPVEEVHHIVPLSKGATRDEKNLTNLCT